MKNTFIFLIILLLAASQSYSQRTDIKYDYYSSGEKQNMYTCINGIPSGPYKAFYKNGHIKAVGNYEYGKLDGVYAVFTEHGDTAHTLLYDLGKVWSKKVFYQEYPDFTYLPISKKGFVIIKDGTPVELDKNTPDGLLEQVYDNQSLKNTYFIWDKGARKEYELPKPDGTLETILTGALPGIYEWKDKKKHFVRALTKEEREGRNNDEILRLLDKLNKNNKTNQD